MILEITRWAGVCAVRGTVERVDLADFLSLFDLIDRPSDKRRLAGWAPAVFHNDVRSMAHCRQINALGLDFDDGDELDAIAEAWAGVDGLLHTTASHRAERPRCRVVLRLSRPISPSEHRQIFAYAVTRSAAADVTVDDKAADPSRLWYVPASLPGQSPIFRQWCGESIEVDAIVRPEPAQMVRAGVIATRVASAYAATAIEAEIDRLMRARAPVNGAPGERNETANACAYKLGRLVGAHLLDADLAVERLMGAARAVGLEEAEARRTIERGMAAGRTRPRHVQRRRCDPTDADVPGYMKGRLT